MSTMVPAIQNEKKLRLVSCFARSLDGSDFLVLLQFYPAPWVAEDRILKDESQRCLQGLPLVQMALGREEY